MGRSSVPSRPTGTELTPPGSPEYNSSMAVHSAVAPRLAHTYSIVARDEVTGERHLVDVDRVGINYSALVPVVIKAMQEQQALLQEQQAQIEALTARLAALETGD